MMEQVTGWIDVLDADEVEVKALADESREHGDEDEEECPF